MSRILMVEDSKEYQHYLSAVLIEHALTFVENFYEASNLLFNKKTHFDLVLLDVSLPDGSGIDLLSQMRESQELSHVPIIIITANHDIVTKVAAFGIGADDYIQKPMDSAEVKARINAKLRWSSIVQGKSSALKYADLSMNLDQLTVDILPRDGKKSEVNLTPHEFKILKIFMQRPDQVFSREQIIENAWGIGKYVSARTVDAHISHLRQKIKASKVSLQTVLGMGYKLSSQTSD